MKQNQKPAAVQVRVPAEWARRLKMEAARTGRRLIDVVTDKLALGWSRSQ